MEKQAELCVPCAMLMQENYALRKTEGGRDHKVTCARCGKRRFGAKYEIRGKRGDGRG